MAERSNTIDYAQAVLSKYPDAHAIIDGHHGCWRISSGYKRPDWLSEIKKDRDAAWRDAYERIYKKGE